MWPKLTVARSACLVAVILISATTGCNAMFGQRFSLEPDSSQVPLWSKKLTLSYRVPEGAVSWGTAIVYEGPENPMAAFGLDTKTNGKKDLIFVLAKTGTSWARTARIESPYVLARLSGLAFSRSVRRLSLICDVGRVESYCLDPLDLQASARHAHGKSTFSGDPRVLVGHVAGYTHSGQDIHAFWRESEQIGIPFLFPDARPYRELLVHGVMTADGSVAAKRITKLGAGWAANFEQLQAIPQGPESCEISILKYKHRFLHKARFRLFRYKYDLRRKKLSSLGTIRFRAQYGMRYSICSGPGGVTYVSYGRGGRKPGDRFVTECYRGRSRLWSAAFDHDQDLADATRGPCQCGRPDCSMSDASERIRLSSSVRALTVALLGPGRLVSIWEDPMLPFLYGATFDLANNTVSRWRLPLPKRRYPMSAVPMDDRRILLVMFRPDGIMDGVIEFPEVRPPKPANAR